MTTENVEINFVIRARLKEIYFDIDPRVIAPHPPLIRSNLTR